MSSIVRATLILLASALLSRSLGIIREIVIAWRFGASAKTDAFYVAFSLPWAFYIVVGTSLTAVIVPLLAEYEAKGHHDETMRVVSLMINVILLSTGTLALGGLLGASQLTWALGGGFDEATLKLATKFTAMMMPSIVFMSVAGVLSGLLNNRHVFGPSALGPVAMNIVIILGVVIGGNLVGIYGPVIGTVLGAMAFIMVQFPALQGIGYKHRWVLSFKDPVVKRIGSQLWPVMMVSILAFLYTLIDFRLASTMAEGSVTALNYAAKIIQLPQGLFVMAVTTAIFPTLSKMATNASKDEMNKYLQKWLRVILLLSIPSAVALIILGEPLVKLMFQRGAFSAQATAMTSSALLFLTIGLLGFCLNIPLMRGFYALQDQYTILLVGLVSIGVKLLLSLVLADSMKHNGLALATSITILLNASLLALLLQRKLNGLFDGAFFMFVCNVMVAAAIMGCVVLLLDNSLTSWLQSGAVMLAGRLATDIATGAFVFAVMAYMFRLDEVRNMVCRIIALR